MNTKSILDRADSWLADYPDPDPILAAPDLIRDMRDYIAGMRWQDSKIILPMDDDWCWCAWDNGRDGWWYGCLQFRFGTQTFYPNGSRPLPDFWMKCKPPENNDA